ncbi:MAG TPA: DUF4388 domain-containing protein, partial [Thermoanaerobaculia bacterium]|nr:DUF4388 domain-containing protein [Thermoanaerobaculia bacterium]
GILTVQGQQDIIAVSFLKGQIVTVDSLNQTQEEGLSQILIREGLLTQAQFSRASAEHQNAGMRLLDLLVERNYVQRDALLRALRLHASRLLSDLLRWDKGEFKFYTGDEVPYEDGFVPLTVEEVLGSTGTMPRRAPGLTAVPPPGPRPVAGPVSGSPASGANASPARPGLRVVRRDGPIPADRQALSAIPALTTPAARPEEPQTVTGQFRKMKVEAPAEERRRPLLMKLLAALLAVLSLSVFFLSPGAAVIPFPWQGEEREALAREQRAALYLKIDRAAKTWFLLSGRFPERLSQLVEAGFLSPQDLRDPQGRPLQYSATEESYTLQPQLAESRPQAGAEATEAITGNFLLDPEFLTLPDESTAPPLVLLD